MLWLIITVLFVIVLFQFIQIYTSKKKIQEISNILNDISNGNLDRRLLANENTMMSELVYKINDIVIHDKEKFMAKDKSDKAYKKLVTSLSHDIRTPLASLIGYLEVLESNSVTEAEHDSFLKIAKTKALNLNDYIQSLFEWLKLESGEWVYDFNQENICELTRIVLADWIIRLEKNNIQFLFDIPEKSLCLLLDKNVFERIMNNILSNILKHSYADYLEVSLKQIETNIIIEITDNGIGMADEELPFIFERLYKCDNSRTENSNGLGLAIAKELISLANGTISVSSKVNSGTTFILQFAIKHE